MPDRDAPIQIRPGDRSTRRRWIERVTLYGLIGSALIHLIVVLIASLISVQFNFADAGGTGQTEGVEFALLDNATTAQDASSLITEPREVVDTTNTLSNMDLNLLSESGQERSVDDLSESIAPSLDPGGGSLTSIDDSTGSAGAGSGGGASFFGLEAKGTRFAYIVDVSSSMHSTGNSTLSRWDLTRNELVRSLRTLEPNASFHVQLYSSGSRSLFGTNEWMPASPANKRLASDGLAATDPNGATNPVPAFDAVFRLEPKPDAIYYMTDGEVSDAAGFSAFVRDLNRADRIPVHCILFGDAGSDDARQRVEALMRNIARQSGGRFTHIKDGRP